MFDDLIEKYGRFCSSYIENEIGRLERMESKDPIKRYNNVLTSYRNTCDALLMYLLQSCRYNEHSKVVQDMLRSVMDEQLLAYRSVVDL